MNLFDNSSTGVPHGVQQSAVLHNPQQFVRHGHVVSHRFLAIVKESVWSPDFTGHQVVETQDVHWPIKLQPRVCPALTEKHIHCIFLRTESDIPGEIRVQDILQCCVSDNIYLTENMCSFNAGSKVQILLLVYVSSMFY